MGTFSIISPVGSVTTTPSRGVDGWIESGGGITDAELISGIVNTDVSLAPADADSGTSDISGEIAFNFNLTDAIISLDGNPAVSFNSLPAGFTIDGGVELDITYFMGNFHATGTFTLGVFRAGPAGQLAIPVNTQGQGGAINFIYPNDTTMLDILNDGFSIEGTQTVIHTGIGGNCRMGFSAFLLYGNYSIQAASFSPKITNTPDKTGDKVVITSPLPGLQSVTQIALNFGGQTIILDKNNPGFYIWSYFVFIQEEFSLEFYIPWGLLNYSGPITVSLIGTEFSGSVTDGIINILFADASGIYKLVKGQTNDILYFREKYTTINQRIMLGYAEDESDYAVKSQEIENSLVSMNYPTAVLAEVEDYDYDDFSVIGVPATAILLYSVEIPSPFIKTGFLP